MTLLEDLRQPLRPSGRFRDLAGMHLPFDHMLGSDRHEAAALQLTTTDTRCVAIVGPPGTGKSSFIAWVAAALPESHVAVVVQGRALGEPGNLEEFLLALLKQGLTQARAFGGGADDIERAGADSVATTTSPASVRGGELGGGPIPAKLTIELESLAEEVRRNPRDLDRLSGIERLIGNFNHHGRTPVFILHDAEAHLGADADQQQRNAFFNTVVGALANDIAAPSLLAVQTRYLSDAAYQAIAPTLIEFQIPTIGDLPATLEALLSHRMQFWGIGAHARDAFTEPALVALAARYSDRGDLRDMLSVADAAVVHALDDADLSDGQTGDTQVDQADVFAAIGGASSRG